MHYLKTLMITTLICILNTGCEQQTFVQQDEGGNEIQGLQYINNAAINFVNEYNTKNGTHWKSLEPNTKTLLDKCLTPLKTSWKSAYTQGFPPPEGATYWSVMVRCDKTASTHPESQKWDVLVLTTRPDRRE